MMESLKNYPKGATHCKYPEHWYDEQFYRLHKDGYLEIFIMGRNEWFRSIESPIMLDLMHKLDK